jgi:hypothetical protein
VATHSHPSANLEELSWYLAHHHHDQWDQFSRDDQAAMVDDDLAAGRSVSLVLVSLITVGMLLTAVTLIAVLLST